MTYFIFRAFAASGTATLYTSPGGSQSVINGQSFTVSVRISSGASVPITGASVYLAYPANELQVLSEDYSGSPYSTQLLVSNSGGILRMDRAAFPMVSGGDQLYAQVTFKAIANGSAAITFTGSSVVTSGQDDSNILSQTSGVTYNISTPAPPPPSSSGGGGSSSGSSSGSSTSGTTSGSKAQPTQSGQTSSSPAPSGSSTSAATSQSSASNSSTTTGSSQITSPPSSNIQSSIDITIVDPQGKPVEGATVTLDGQSVKTDKDGIAHFDGIPTGNQALTVTYNGKKTTKAIQIKEASAQLPEAFKVSLANNKFNLALLAIPVLVLLAAASFILRPWGLMFAKNPAVAVEPDKIVTSNEPPEVPHTPAYHELETPGRVYSPEPTEPGKSPTEHSNEADK